jgi:hypothetical protein
MLFPSLIGCRNCFDYIFLDLKVITTSFSLILILLLGKPTVAELMKKFFVARFEASTAVTMKNVVFGVWRCVGLVLTASSG